MCFVSLVRLMALFGFVRPARLSFRAGKVCKPLANVAVADGAQGEPDWHVAFMDSAHAGRKAAEESSDSFDLLAIVPDALSQDDRDTFGGFGFTVVPRPPFLPLRKVKNSFGIDHVIIMTGTNDLGVSADKETITQYVLALRDTCHRAGVRTLILSLHPKSGTKRVVPRCYLYASRWEYLNMTLRQNCWSEDCGDGLTAGINKAGQRISQYGQGLSKALAHWDVCVCGLNELKVLELSEEDDARLMEEADAVSSLVRFLKNGSPSTCWSSWWVRSTWSRELLLAWCFTTSKPCARSVKCNTSAQWC